VHRDVKPENVLLTADGRVKVVDFGLARASAAVGNTQAGQIIGSVNYISPEQVTGYPTDARTDVYSAGVMLFEMITGQQPFAGDTPLAIAYEHVNSAVPAVSTLVHGVPAPVEQLVGAATSRDPGLRPANAAVFMAAARSLRGLPAPDGEAAPAGAPPAWDGPGTALHSPAAAPYAAGGQASGDEGNSHTMIVGPQYPGYTAGYQGGHTGGYPRPRAGGTAPGAGGHELVLAQWLFSHRLVYVLATVLVLVCAVGGGWYLTSGRYAAVPAVSRLNAATAVSALREAGFKVATAPSVVDDNVPKGEVISTSPSGRALPGATITVTVSLGPRMITVPQVPANDTVAQATAALREAGLTVAPKANPVGVPSNPQIGTIAGTTPAAGTSWPENKPVVIDQVEGLGVPNLVGQNIQSIQGWAGQQGINVQPTQVSNSALQGTILTQSPQPGAIITQGQTVVTVTVSNGGPQIQIPQVNGQSCQQAQQTIKQAGFSNVTAQSGFFGKGNASGTNPGEGSMVQAATPIQVQCGFGAGFGGGF
jgi:serine/threonine-protein kinase